MEEPKQQLTLILGQVQNLANQIKKFIPDNQHEFIDPSITNFDKVKDIHLDLPNENTHNSNIQIRGENLTNITSQRMSPKMAHIDSRKTIITID